MGSKFLKKCISKLKKKGLIRLRKKNTPPELPIFHNVKLSPCVAYIETLYSKKNVLSSLIIPFPRGLIPR